MSIFKRIKQAFQKPASPENMPAEHSAPMQFPPSIIDPGCIPEYLAEGTFGTVYKVTKNGMPAAVKVIVCKTDSERKRAEQEGRIMRSLSFNDFTVKLKDMDIISREDGCIVYLLQEYLTDLETYCAAHTLTTKDIIGLGQDICLALTFCELDRVHHLDIQPKNIFVHRDGHFVLGDFGSAAYGHELLSPQPLRGTLAYMAPEGYSRHQYSAASDVYSLGLLLYTLLNDGNLPFTDTHSKEEAIQLRLQGSPIPPLHLQNKVLEDCLQTACSPDLKNRYATIRELSSALDAALSAETASSVHVPSAELFATDTVSTTCAVECNRVRTAPIAPPPFTPTAPAPAPFMPPPPAPARQAPPAPMAATAPSMSYGNAAPPSHAIPPSFFHEGTAALTAPAPSVSAPPPAMTQVQFSAIAPKTVTKGEYALVQLYMYEEAFRSVVDEAIAEAETEMTRKNSGILKVGDQTRVKVILTSPDVEIEDNENEQVWYGDYLVFDFAFEVPAELKKKQLLLKAAVYLNDLPATKLLLTLKAQEDQTPTLEMQRNDVRRAYMSYAREDQSRVGSLVQGMRRVRPDLEIFFDVFNLRCGDNWEQSLFQNLEKADMLFLCWSRSAKNSVWVEREWRYMLTNKGADSIEPLPIEPPEICPPPAELSMKYFNDNLLYMIDPKTSW